MLWSQSTVVSYLGSSQHSKLRTNTEFFQTVIWKERGGPSCLTGLALSFGICTASLAKSRCLERCLMKWPEVKQKQFCPPVPWLWLWIPLYRRRAKNIFKVIVTPCPWAQTHCLQCISYLTVITPALLFMLLREQGIFSYIIVFSPHDKPTRAGSWPLFYKVVVQVHTTIKVKWGLEQWILILILGFVLLLLLCIAS